MIKIMTDKWAKPDGLEPIVDETFDECKTLLTGTDAQKRIMMDIDGASWIDNERCADRYGYTIHIEDLSTGCKAALAVSVKPDKPVNFTECGVNAIAAVINHCDTGWVYTKDRNLCRMAISDDISVQYNGKVYSSATELLRYFREDYKE